MRPTFALVFIPVLIVSTVTAQPSKTKWPRDVTAVMTVTMDDNIASQYDLALPALDARGIDATLFIVTQNVTNWPQIVAASEQGHDIGSHTITHSWLTNMTLADAEQELSESRDTIEAHITDRPCVSFAAPFCARNTDIDALVMQYYLADRTCGGSNVINLPGPNLADIKGNTTDSESGSPVRLATLTNWVDLAISRGGWFVQYQHGFSTGLTSGMNVDTFSAYLDYAAAKRDAGEIFIATLGDMARFIRERNVCTITTLSDNTDEKRYGLTDGLDDAIFTYPLTFSMDIPGTWASATVTQNGVPMWSSLDGTALLFEALPDAGEIVVANTAVAVRHAAPQLVQPRASLPGTVSLLDGRRAVNGGELWSVRVVSGASTLVLPSRR